MEAVGLSPAFWRGKRVLLTGHTGFKGSWLALWLKSLGANVTGFALEPSTTPSLFELARVAESLDDQRGDLRDLGALLELIAETQPEIVLHLAAQPLVREGYRDPLGTYSSNVMGTLNLLEAIRQVGGVRACVLVTTDKVYANQEWLWPYRENEPLGGHDPYSSSKACCELLAQSYAASFFHPERYAEHGLALATARAGNVLGGGDFAAERLIPDVFKAWSANEPVTLRYPKAVRPWQHALEPLAGYLQLATGLYQHGPEFAGAWNFGPGESDMCSVGEVVSTLASHWPQAAGLRIEPSDLHEAGLLRLDSSRARQLLAWQPRWSLQQCLEQTLEWHLAWKNGEDMRAVTLAQLEQYRGAAVSEFLLKALPLAGLFSVQHKRHEDQRGHFARMICEGSLSAVGQPFHIRQINHSCTRERGSVRGLHYQTAQAPEAKMITCMRGEVWDVAVDLRPDSETFLHWHAEHLRAGDGRSLLIPAGFAHGFQALTDDAELLYLHSADYSPGHEAGLSVHDPRLAIGWPLSVKNLSARDSGHSLLDSSFAGVRL